MDWCTRAKEVGYEIHAINASRVFHKMGAVNLVNTFSNYYFERNRIYFFLKHISFDAISSFTDTIASEIINITYFAYHKGQHSNAISMLIAIDDVERDYFYRQDDHIFSKEEIKPFSSINLKSSAVVAVVISGNLHHDRNVFYALEHSLDLPITLYTKRNHKNISSQFPDNTVCDISDLRAENYDAVFHVVEHLSLFQAETTEFFSNSIIVDWYLNVQHASDIEAFMKSYETYKNIFHSIYKPILQIKFELVHKKIHSNATINIC